MRIWILLAVLASTSSLAAPTCPDLLLSGLSIHQQVYFSGQTATPLSIPALRHSFGTRIDARTYLVLEDTSKNTSYLNRVIRVRFKLSRWEANNLSNALPGRPGIPFPMLLAVSGLKEVAPFETFDFSNPHHDTAYLNAAVDLIHALAVLFAIYESRRTLFGWKSEMDFIQSVQMLTPWCAACAGA